MMARLLAATTLVFCGWAQAPLVPSSAASAAAAPSSATGDSAGSIRSDFNADGFADLAVAAPHEDKFGAKDIGAVTVLYGSASGLQADGSGGPDDQYWTQDSPGVAGEGAEQDDQFGASLAAGDFDADGFADLAIGAPYEDTGGIYDVGAVTVLYGSPAGLQADGIGGRDDQYWSQDDPDVEDTGELRDQFGISLAEQDFNGDGFSDLAVGIPDESIPDIAWGPGAVSILYGSASGLQADGTGAPDDQFWTQDSPSVKDKAEGADAFGAGVIAGDFNGDGFGDLAVGTPLEDAPSVSNAGSVNVLYGSASGLQADGIGAPPDDQFWTQDSPGVEDASEGQDRFGIWTTTGDFNADGYDDMAVGTRFEDVGTIVDAGTTNVIYGSPAGLQANGNGGPDDQIWNQDSTDVADHSETQDEFGRALTAEDFNGDGFGDLAVGVWAESLGGISQAGAVNVLYGSAAGLQTVSPADQFWTQNSTGISGDGAESTDRLGRALGAGDFNGDGIADLAAGSLEGVGSAKSAGAVNVLYGSLAGLQATGTGGPDDQFWTQDSPGVQGDGARKGDLFGSYVTGED
jgi:hypothetical protein